MWKAAESTSKFFWNHRGKLIVTAAIAIGAAAYVHYYNSSETQRESDNNNHNEDLAMLTSNSTERNLKNTLSKEKIRMLLQARKQFDFSSRQFLMTLRLQIIETVDISSVLRQIRELRKTSQSTSEISNQELESKLWEDVKVASFTQLFVTIYMVSILCTLLRVQMHLLAQHFSISIGNPIDYQKNQDDNDDIEYDNSSLFLSIVEETYKHMFGSGLKTLTSIIRQKVLTGFKDWIVQDKQNVEYGELVQIISQTRRYLESDIANMIKIVILPPEATSSKSINENITVTNATINNHNENELNNTNNNSNNNNSFNSQAIVHKLWEISESPMFAAALVEVIDSCYSKVFELFRQSIYLNSSIVGITNDQYNLVMNSPALATLLPQVKAISLVFLPNDSNSINIKDIISGPVLESLCMSTFQIK